MQDLLSELRGSYELIVLDCAPMLGVAETCSVVRLADATVIVARAGKTPKTTAASAIDQVRQAGGSVLGVVLNGVKPRHHGLHFHFDLRNFRIVRKEPDAKAG
jgi:Mrp family chromosome partitioning ATPase